MPRSLLHVPLCTWALLPALKTASCCPPRSSMAYPSRGPHFYLGLSLSQHRILLQCLPSSPIQGSSASPVVAPHPTSPRICPRICPRAQAVAQPQRGRSADVLQGCCGHAAVMLLPCCCHAATVHLLIGFVCLLVCFPCLQNLTMEAVVAMAHGEALQTSIDSAGLKVCG